MCVNGKRLVSAFTDLAGRFFGLICFHTRKHTQAHSPQIQNMFWCCCAKWPCRLTRAHYRAKQQWNQWQWKADMTRQIVRANMKAVSDQEEREGTGWHCKKEQTEPSTNSNVNCSGLHNLRLMRKHRQIKSPSLYPGWISSTGALFIKKASEAVL